ncbi:MAG TPA: hypothetical protein VG406_23065 [Isosphaeraceae bacterium]|jgi:hypothetical protein|nr:hypothetical protein [Isosphaeraceae bacterium]
MVRAGRPFALGSCLALGGLLFFGPASARAQVAGSVARSAAGIGAQGTDGRTNPSEWGTVVSSTRVVAPARVVARPVRRTYSSVAPQRRGFFRPRPTSERRDYSNGAEGVSPRAANQ